MMKKFDDIRSCFRHNTMGWRTDGWTDEFITAKMRCQLY